MNKTIASASFDQPAPGIIEQPVYSLSDCLIFAFRACSGASQIGSPPLDSEIP